MKNANTRSMGMPAPDRALTAPPSNAPLGNSTSTAEDGTNTLVMSPIVESPTGITHVISQDTSGPVRASQTLPNIPSSALLSAPDNSDAASVRSTGSTSKKQRKMSFRRPSAKDAAMAQAGTQTPGTPSSVSLAKSPKRKNTGLAGALAASGLAMANSAFAMPQIAPADIMGRPDRSESVTSNGATSHRARSSVDNTRSPTRARQTSISYATSEYSDHDSFVSGVEGASDDDDDLDLDADNIPVTGFAVASARRNQEFHEMFPNIPEGDYLIEGACASLRRK